MGLKEGLLCLLVKEDAHGYQLKTDLEATTGDTWQINIGQVYTTLQRLERDGLVESTESNGDGRVVYTLTDTGREEATMWLTRPVDLAASGRDEISLKVLMAMRTGVGDPRRVIEKQRGSTMGMLQDFTALKSDSTNQDFAWQIYLDRLIFSAEAELRWLERVESRLEEISASPANRESTEHIKEMEEAR
jgi:DNA-binding PadR family transcriptional regulator